VQITKGWYNFLNNMTKRKGTFLLHNFRGNEVMYPSSDVGHGLLPAAPTSWGRPHDSLAGRLRGCMCRVGASCLHIHELCDPRRHDIWIFSISLACRWKDRELREAKYFAPNHSLKRKSLIFLLAECSHHLYLLLYTPTWGRVSLAPNSQEAAKKVL
jgi:hypothetical protein